MQDTIKEGRTLAIVCYFTFVGLIIAIIMNLEKRNPFTFFHARQMLGLIIMLLVSNVSEKYINSWLGTVFWTITFVAWLYGLYTAYKGEQKPIPVVGDYFQDWFRTIS
ncbi:putative membrane protein [Flavobacteriaceae bacterium MAR_2010_72]|nr:putative membrane protein [Flavobacteriaceae bacterium MAR_2010_72]TVZ59598.1 putative membrane protein [Flavobacteriaceae bacterium MAR_2010_105]